MSDEYDDENSGFSLSDQEEVGDEILESLDEEAMDNEQIVDHTADIMNQAMYRIEEANLFKILINHEIFAANSARSEILEAVNRKIKKFALRELNLLLNLQKEEPKIQHVQQPAQFSNEEAAVLKMLIGKVLKKDPVAVVASVPERKPEILQVAAPKPAVNQIRPKQAVQARQARLSQPQAPQSQRPLQKKGRGKARAKGDGFATNSNPAQVKPMPSVEAQMMHYGQQAPQVVLSKEKGVSGGAAQQGAGTMKSIISGMTGGGMSIAIDDSNPADAAMDSGDVNGRF